MSADLMSLNQSKVTTVLNCRVGVALKGRFTLLAAEKGMNVNQLLSIIVDEAVEKKNEDLLQKTILESNMLQKKFTELEHHVSELQKDYTAESEKVRILLEDNLRITTELHTRTKELKSHKQDLEASRKDHSQANRTTQEWKSAHDNLKKQYEKSERQRNAAYEKVKLLEQEKNDILKKNSEVIAQLKKEQSESIFNLVPEWAWLTLRGLVTVAPEVALIVTEL